MAVIHVYIDADPALGGSLAPDVPVSADELTTLANTTDTISTPFDVAGTGVRFLVVRQNVPATLVNTDNDYTMLSVDTDGKLWVRDDAPSNPFIYRITLGLANVEYVRDLPDNAKSLMFRAENDADIRYSFETGHVGDATSPYMILRSGEVYSKEHINLAAGMALYLGSATAGTVVEIEAWN